MNLQAFLTRRPEVAATASREYPVNLYLDPDGDYWIAESDDLPIATEADTLDALIERVWLIAPEIAALNGHQGELNLRFILHTSARWRERSIASSSGYSAQKVAPSFGRERVATKSGSAQ